MTKLDDGHYTFVAEHFPQVQRLHDFSYECNGCKEPKEIRVPANWASLVPLLEILAANFSDVEILRLAVGDEQYGKEEMIEWWPLQYSAQYSELELEHHAGNVPDYREIVEGRRDSPDVLVIAYMNAISLIS